MVKIFNELREVTREIMKESAENDLILCVLKKQVVGEKGRK